MEFYFFHLMPYTDLPADFYDRYDSAWVTCPNELFDPRLGTELYNRYLDEMIYAEELGWDGVCVNEHHQTAYGLMPSPNLMAAILARQTKRVRIAILGNAAPLYDQPLKVAEEVAMIDVISGGRVIAGFVRGVGCEYFSFSESPAFSRERFDEAVALILRAWTEDGPFSHHGKHYQFRYVNPWPKPVQKPHPAVFVPSTGSVETLEWATEARFPFIRVYDEVAAVQRMFEDYRERAARRGWEAGPEHLGWMVPVYVGETDAQAQAEAERHILYLFRELTKRPIQMLLPPGYSSPQSMARFAENLLKRRDAGKRTFEEMQDKGFIVFGSAETVRQRLLDYQQRLGFGKLVTLLQFGSLPADLTRQNMERFAREVMPALRPIGVSPSPAAVTG
jgi:alkanesulfonate monooxygenase SsuD/methylene tetrahydromethanopterin reductase-like flavin-dependent oxidoreductase (luciferase family)